MSRHLSTESLSAYLDGETGAAEEQQLAAHLTACAACRSRLEAMRRLVAGLGRTALVPPPADLAALVRSRLSAEAAAAAGARGWQEEGSEARFRWRSSAAWQWSRRWLRSARSLWQPVSWWQGLPPLRGALGAPLSAGLALLVAVLLLQSGESVSGPPYPPVSAARPAFLVSEVFGDAPAVLPPTTSEVAGRVFVWSGNLWVQRGLDPGDPGQSRAVLARSPAGRALLARFADLGVLLADGSRVVLRDNYETLELWNGS